MQPQALTYFAEVARTGSIRLAAQKFNLAPSAISRQIAQLEREMGLSLFERSSRGMACTPSGQILKRFIAETELRLEHLRAEIDDLTALKRGKVRLSVVEAASGDFLAQLVTEFAAVAPGIEFHVRVCGTHQIADDIAKEQADIGIAFNVLSRDDLLLRGRIPQPLQVICRAGHELASRASLSFGELAGFRMALPVRSFGIRHLIEEAAMKAGVELSISCEADSLHMIKAIVQRSDVISFMPPLTFAHEVEQGVLCGVGLRDSASEQASVDIVTSRRHVLSSAASAFLALLLQRVRSGRCAAPDTDLRR
jgi:DNA-binding transcriptional LysR family regulator